MMQPCEASPSTTRPRLYPTLLDTVLSKMQLTKLLHSIVWITQHHLTVVASSGAARSLLSPVLMVAHHEVVRLTVAMQLASGQTKPISLHDGFSVNR